MPRRPYTPDDCWRVAKRLRLAQKLRAIFYGINPAPVFGEGRRREMSWAWQCREFVRHRAFRYSELLDIAREMVAQSHPAVLSARNDPGLENDLELLKAWERRVRAIRFAERRWERRPTTAELEQAASEYEAKKMLLYGLCPICGDSTPCAACGTPAVEIDGRGGIRAVAS